jgi:phage terminase large subunit-like protein
MSHSASPMTTSAPRYSASSIASLPLWERKAWLESLDRAELLRVTYDWKFWARPSQLPPEGEWIYWLILAGRGFGKTRAGAEQIIEWARDKRNRRIALVGKDPADARDVMLEGESGILTISPPWFYPKYEATKKKLTWPNGNMAWIYSGAEPEGLRGPNFHKAWCDEIRAWQYPQLAWDNLMFGLRLGDHPQVVITTTGRRIKVLTDLIADPDTAITKGSTYDNYSNLAAPFIKRVITKYEGTRLGDQELRGLILEDVPGALWKRKWIDDARLIVMPPKLGRIVVGLDPAVTSTDNSHETGIVVAARGVGKLSDHCYVLADRSGHHATTEWARLAVRSFKDFEADRIVPETNNGGDLVEDSIRVVDPMVPVRQVKASRGKRGRSEPVAALYEQGKVHHVGSLGALEDEMTNFVPDDREDAESGYNRVDALTWAISDLMFGARFVQT